MTPSGLTEHSPVQPLRTAGIYIGEPPGKMLAIHLSLDVVDRMLREVMRGFGAVPRRGAEVGGFLLGRVGWAGKLIVHIEDFVPLPIEYRYGPSYTTSSKDRAAFHQRLLQSRAGSDGSLRPVGYFRSNTRDTMRLDAEDLDMVAEFFPDAKDIALLIKPFATRPSTAGLFFRENGAFAENGPRLEFPFRRRELDPDRTGLTPSTKERGRGRRPRPAVELPASELEARAVDESTPSTLPLEPVYTPRIAGYSPPRWMFLGCASLLAGLAIGFQASRIIWLHDPYELHVSAETAERNVRLTWDNASRAIQLATRGMLTIEDGEQSKTLDLDLNQLHDGMVVYRPKSTKVHFTLEISPRRGTSITQSADWKR